MEEIKYLKKCFSTASDLNILIVKPGTMWYGCIISLGDYGYDKKPRKKSSFIATGRQYALRLHAQKCCRRYELMMMLTQMNAQKKKPKNGTVTL